MAESRTAAELLAALTAMHAEYFAEEPDGALIQTCLLEFGEGQAFIPCPWADEAERELMIFALRAIIEAHQAHRYAIWAEVWKVDRHVFAPMSPAEAEAEMDRMPHGEIEHVPGRVEAVFTLVVERDGGSIGASQRIVRGADGRVLRLEPDEGGDFDISGGALANLFPPRRYDA